MINKRGVFFSTDALIALAVILTGTLIIFPLVDIGNPEKFVQSDIVKALSTLEIGEINNSVVSELIAQGLVKDLNKSVLEQIGEFYVTNKTIAKELSEVIFDDIDTNENFGIWFGSELIASKNSSNFEDSGRIVVERQIISGIQEGESVTGFSGRAFLSSSLRNKYFYFGGYVGEGNISALIEYDGNITSAKIELAIVNDFEVYVNGFYAGNYSGSGSEYIPVIYSLPIGNFSSGINIVEFRKNGNLNIAGGFIRLTYESAISFNNTKRYYFPGMEGVINLFDGFYIPGNINSMSLSLHYLNNFTTFLNIGNITVYNGSSPTETTMFLNNITLSSLLDYNSLNKKTIPLRLGVDEADYNLNISKPADVFSLTDLSGSMNQQGLVDLAKDANKAFIEALLKMSGNRVGLIGYQSTIVEGYFHPLSADNASLQSTVSSWGANSQTCVCCAINRATSEFNTTSTIDKFQTMVVMSDGGATQTCSEQGTGSADGDAILAACQAQDDYGIRVYALGFGDLNAGEEVTLQDIATCGNGNYYYGDIDQLIEVYEEIANDIIRASFFEQTVNITGNIYSRLWPDSYIEFDYNESAAPFGLITTTEKSFDNEYSGTFDIPINSTILETRVISYSGQRWTDNLWINSTNIYNLSRYGIDFLDLGDPYSVNIPNSLIDLNNVVNLTTGLAPGNSTGGSTSNKIIYTVVQDNVGAYSSLSTSADGCIWELEFGSGTNLSINIPSNYSGNNLCYYTSSGQNISNTNDALQIAVRNLLELLDFNSDGKLDVEFNAQALDISSSEITGIPFDWSTEMQIRTWS